MSAKEELIAEVSRSRAAIAQDSALVSEELNLVSKLKHSVRSRPFAWLGGAAALGYVLAGPKTRTKTVTKFVRGGDKPRIEKKKKHGILGGLFAALKFFSPLLRPALSAYAMRRLTKFAEELGR